jgi:ligand-binding sensor domain-containing protein
MFFHWLLGALVLLSPVLKAQSLNPTANPSSRLLSDEDGLPSMEVYNLYQDSKGYLWIGTADGVCRYDGIRFTKYVSENLTGRALTGMIEDKQGRIWCHNFTGQVLYVEGDSLNVVANWTQNISFGFPIVFIDRKNTLWAGSNKGLFQYHRESSQWKKAPSPTGKNDLDVPLDLRMDSKGNYWYINFLSEVYRSRDMKTWKKMTFLDEQGNEVEDEKLMSNPIISSLGDRAMVFSRNTKSIFVMDNGVFRRNSKLEEALKNSAVFTGANDCLGRYFCLSTYSGIYLFDSTYQLLHSYPYFQDKSISEVITDREGNWWVATLGSGILFFPSLDALQLLPQENIGHRCMKVVGGPDETLLSAMQNGLIYQIDPESGQTLFRYQVPINKNESAVHYWKEENRIVTGSDYVLTFRPGKNKSEMLLQAGCIKSIVAGPSGSLLYVSCFKAALLGGKMPDPKWDLVINTPGERPERLFRKNRCRVALYDSLSEKIWVAYQDGVYCYTSDGYEEVKTASGQSLFASAIAIQKDTLWVGTVSNGLFAFVGQQQILNFNAQNLLNTDAITSIALEPGKVWVGSYAGLTHIDLLSRQTSTFDKANGLPSNEINDLYLKGNRLWLATGKGLASIPTNFQAQNKYRPSVYLSGLIVNDQVFDPSKSPKLEYEQNNLIFELSGISFRSWGTFRYKYRMQGLDTGWQYSNASDRLARFLSLSPGEYVFEAHAINEDGVESAELVHFPFEILRPFWMQWWFLSFCGLSTLGLVAFYFQNRIKQLQIKNRLALEQAALKNEKEQIEQKLKISTLTAIKAQMNPHFIFNALNAIQNFFITDDKSRANEYLGKFSDLMRRILDMSNKELIDLQEELEALKLYLELEQVRFGQSFSYHLHTELECEADEIMLPTMLVQPYIENALKHGLLHKKQDRKLEIAFYQKGDFLRVKIDDNGVGRARSAQINQDRKKYTSFSTQANQQRLDLLNSELGGNLSVEVIDKVDLQNQSIGTTVWLNIPVKTNN